MRQNLRPPKRAVRVSRQEGNRVSDLSLSPQENLEGRALHCEGARFGVVIEPLTTGEPSLSRRRIADFTCGDHGVLDGKTCSSHPCAYPFGSGLVKYSHRFQAIAADSAASGATTTSTFPVATS